MASSIPRRHRDGRADPIRRHTALLASAGITLAVPLAAAAPAAALIAAAPPTSTQLTLPAPTGHHPIGTITLDLIDKTRRDPWVPADPIRVEAQLWYPAATVADYPRAPWMPTAVARSFEKDNGLPVLNWPITHGHLGAPVAAHPCGWPVVLYSPGLGDDAETNTVEAENLASHGYIVVTMDFVHQAGEVELPHGQLITSALPPLTTQNEQSVTTTEVDTNAATTSFVIDQLTALDRGANPDHEHRPLPPGLTGALNLDRIGMFGHSDGGSTTGQVLHDDPRVKAGIDLDGSFWTPQAQAGSDRPMLMFGEQDLAPAEASSWAVFRRNQQGPSYQLSLADSKHATFTDTAALVPQVAPIIGFTPQQVAELVGTISADRAVTVLRTYINAFFDTYLCDHPSPLLDGPSPKFPEVTFIT